MAKAIGFIGLGRMGCGMARNMAQSAESSVVMFDIRECAVDDALTSGALRAASIADVASQCSMIFLCLPAAKEVRETIFASDGIARHAQSGTLIVDTTTLDREDALDMAARAGKAGMGYCDCPVSGMPFRAVNGTLTAMFGGTPDEFARAKPLIDTFAAFAIHGGPVGSGQAMKAINNIIYNVNIAALCEVLPLAVAIGLDPAAIATLVTTASSKSFASDYFVPRMMARQFDTDFTMRAAYKDIINIQRMGLETKASLPVVNAMIATYQAAMASGFADEPKSAMLKIYERQLGVEFCRNGKS